MNSITLQELVGYLPYEVEIELKRKECNGYYTEFWITNNTDYPIAVQVSETTRYAAMLSEIKPLLLPLSWLKTTEGKEWLKSMKYRSDENGILFIISDIEHKVIEWSFVEQAYKIHLDIHNLIERGLAIDKSTLNK